MDIMKMGSFVKMTTEKNILLYLKDEKLSANKNIKASISTTQIGIVNILGISLSTVSRVLKKQIENRDVIVRKRYIHGINRQIKAFFLTSKGLAKKKQLEEELLKQSILLKGKDGNFQEVKLLKVDYHLGTRTTIFEKVISISKEGILDQNVLNQNLLKCHNLGVKKVVNVTNHISKPEYFFGREKELIKLRKLIVSKKPNIITIYGFAGIGKTKLISKLIYEYEGKKNTFWFDIHEWNNIKDILQSFSEFLSQIGKRKLKNYLKSKEIPSLTKVIHILEMELKNIDVILVFDNCEKANKEILQFFLILKPDFQRKLR